MKLKLIIIVICSVLNGLVVYKIENSPFLNPIKASTIWESLIIFVFSFSFVFFYIRYLKKKSITNINLWNTSLVKKDDFLTKLHFLMYLSFFVGLLLVISGFLKNRVIINDGLLILIFGLGGIVSFLYLSKCKVPCNLHE